MSHTHNPQIIDELAQFNLTTDPLKSFESWYLEALKIEDNADAMSLATVDIKLDRPLVRTVLYKGMVDNKIIFYTNYESEKGQQLAINNQVSLLFYWHKSIRQVRIQGKVEKVSEEQSQNYFHSRDKESQLASYISNQSKPISSKNELISKLEAASQKFKESEVPKPKHWGGYAVTPYELEFFIYGKNRLNDRFLFEKMDGNWILNRLQP